MNVDIHVLAILLAVVANMAIGFIWYGAPLFGAAWMKMNGLTKKDTQSNSGLPMLAMFVLAIVQAYVLRHFIVYSQAFYPTHSATSVGFLTGLWAWLGIAAPVLGANYMFAGRRKKLLLIDAGYYLITLPIMGIILARII